VETLRCVAALRSQKGALRTRFDTFGHDPQAERMAKLNDRAHNRLGIPTMPEVSDKGLVDLDLVYRKLSQPPQAGIACSKVVDRNSNAFRMESI
jgi:hypothetical protein